MSSPPEDSGWEAGWDGHERAQRARLARLPFAAKLQWLEEAHALIRHMRHGADPRITLPSQSDEASEQPAPR